MRRFPPRGCGTRHPLPCRRAAFGRWGRPPNNSRRAAATPPTTSSATTFRRRRRRPLIIASGSPPSNPSIPSVRSPAKCPKSAATPRITNPDSTTRTCDPCPNPPSPRTTGTSTSPTSIPSTSTTGDGPKPTTASAASAPASTPEAARPNNIRNNKSRPTLSSTNPAPLPNHRHHLPPLVDFPLLLLLAPPLYDVPHRLPLTSVAFAPRAGLLHSRADVSPPSHYAHQPTNHHHGTTRAC
mmetsp:Transcript_11267/g.28652  ORF Transcript_11267/g.28652 Transcript_11267/m.28652 type:complete len:240 (+) Transcript_11267:144-863(+)